MKRVFACGLIATLSLVACSSTGPVATRDDAASATAPSPADSAEGRILVGEGEATAIGADQGPTATPDSPSRSPAGSAGAATKPAAGYGPSSPGVSRSAVKVGIWVLNTDATCNATGAAGRTGRGDCGDRSHTAEWEAMTKWINARGGVAGRRLDVVFHETLANNSSWTAQAESACEAFARDQKVFLAVSELQIGRPHFVRCMAAQGIPVIDPGTWVWDAEDYEQLFPYLYQPSRARADRAMRAYVDGLAARRFFEGDVRAGLLRFDSPAHERVTKTVILPRLAAHGVEEIEEAVLRTPASIAALGDLNAEMSSHILRFKNADVNRVLFFVNSEVQFFYFKQADSQAFRPRYGMSSLDWLTLSADNAPQSQLEGAVAVGWLPGYDTPREKDPGTTAPMRTCLSAMKAGGVEDTYAGRNIKCDALFFMKQVLDRAPALNPKGLRAAAEALGASFEPVATFATRFGPGRYDGPTAWRYLTYQGSCSCFVYTGASKPL